jgi:chromosome partitioning protein
MAVVTFASTKGGSGKTTSALVFGSELHKHGANILFVEGDPNRSIANWAVRQDFAVIDATKARPQSAQEAQAYVQEAAARRPDRSKIVVVTTDGSDEGLFEWLEGGAEWAHFVVCDPEGSANEWLTTVAAVSDLVIIPAQPSKLDAMQIGKTVKALQKFAKISKRAVNYRVLLTRASAIMTKDEREIRQELVEANIPLLRETLFERAAYRALTKYDALMADLTDADVSGLAKARLNAAAFANEILELVQAIRDSSGKAAA